MAYDCVRFDTHALYLSLPYSGKSMPSLLAAMPAHQSLVVQQQHIASQPGYVGACVQPRMPWLFPCYLHTSTVVSIRRSHAVSLIGVLCVPHPPVSPPLHLCTSVPCTPLLHIGSGPPTLRLPGPASSSTSATYPQRVSVASTVHGPSVRRATAGWCALFAPLGTSCMQAPVYYAGPLSVECACVCACVLVRWYAFPLVRV